MIEALFGAEMARQVRVVNRTPSTLSAHGVASVVESLAEPIVGYLEPINTVGTGEALVNQSAQTATHLLILPSGPTLSGNEAVEVDGVRYEITGPPRRYQDGRDEHHVEVDLHRTVG